MLPAALPRSGGAWPNVWAFPLKEDMDSCCYAAMQARRVCRLEEHPTGALATPCKPAAGAGGVVPRQGQ